jgi:hypothetical protein
VSHSTPTILDVLAAHDRLVEVGIGHRTDLAAALTERGCAVTATDVVPREVPAGVGFVVEDLLDPEMGHYADAEAIYALRLPPELQRPAAALADRLGLPLYFTTLGGDPAVVEHEPRTVQSGTLYVHGPRSSEDGPTGTHNR